MTRMTRPDCAVMCNLINTHTHTHTHKHTHMVCVLTRALWLVGDFSCDCMFCDEKGGELTGQPVGPQQVDTATITTGTSTNRVDSGGLSSRCCTFRRTHASIGPIRLLWIRLALPLTLSMPSGLAPSARLVVGVTPYPLWLSGDFSCDCMFGTRGEEDLLGNRWAHWWVQQP